MAAMDLLEAADSLRDSCYISGRRFPPPLAIGSQMRHCGFPHCPNQIVRGNRLQAVRSRGRFVLREVERETQHCVSFQRTRNQGRLQLHLIRHSSSSSGGASERRSLEAPPELKSVGVSSDFAKSGGEIQSQAASGSGLRIPRPEAESIRKNRDQSSVLAAAPSPSSSGSRRLFLAHQSGSGSGDKKILVEKDKEKKKLLEEAHVLQELIANRMASISPLCNRDEEHRPMMWEHRNFQCVTTSS